MPSPFDFLISSLLRNSKAKNAEWWDGTALYHVLNRFDYLATDFGELLRDAPPIVHWFGTVSSFWLQLVGWLFLWVPIEPLRRYGLVFIVLSFMAMHIGIGKRSLLCFRCHDLLGCDILSTGL